MATRIFYEKVDSSGKYQYSYNGVPNMPETVPLAFRESNGKAPVTDWLEQLSLRDPTAYAKALAHIKLLGEHGYELRRPNADILERGVYELRFRVDTVQYRIFYFFSGPNEATLSHGMSGKKQRRIPEGEIDLAAHRKAAVANDKRKHTTHDWDFAK